MNYGALSMCSELWIMHQFGNLIIGEKRLPDSVSSSQPNNGILFLGYKLANQTAFIQIFSEP
jgi:hypothetical protein